jgi:S1-C subfamily serine protease
LTWRDEAGQRRTAPLGSGFVVSAQGHVVTTQHVVANGRKRLAGLESGEAAGLIAALAGAGAHEDPIELELSTLAEYPDFDLALLEPAVDPFSSRADPRARDILDGANPRGVAQLSLEPPEHGAAVLLSGYPKGQKQLNRASGRLVDAAFLSEVGVRNEPSPGWIDRMRAQGIYLADLDTKPGHSGGPVSLAKTGGVIGVCSSVMSLSTSGAGAYPLRFPLRYSTQITVLIPAAALARILHAHGVPWRESE